MKIQIWTALIALLLVRYLQLRSRVQWHLSRFLALLRHQRFVYRDLWRFLDDPFDGPPPLRKDYVAPQPSLFAMIEAGPPETRHPANVGQPYIQNTEIASASPLLSNQHNRFRVDLDTSVQQHKKRCAGKVESRYPNFRSRSPDRKL